MTGRLGMKDFLITGGFIACYREFCKTNACPYNSGHPAWPEKNGK